MGKNNKKSTRKRKKPDVILDFSNRVKQKEPQKCDKPLSKNTKKRSNKLSLSTNSNDYGGSVKLPEKLTQGQFETTGQFMRRIDRLAAKAKVEASMEARFDMRLNK